MKIHLKTYDDVIPCSLPYAGCAHVELDGECPACGEQGAKVQGGDVTRGHDTYTAPAVCLSCRQKVGLLVVTMRTLFGLAEDEAVPQGRGRVY